MSKFVSDRERTISRMAKTDVLFHVERRDGSVDEFRKGDLAHYVDSVVTIVDIPDTVMGHIIETPTGGLICLDVATVLLNGKFTNVETDKLYPVYNQ